MTKHPKINLLLVEDDPDAAQQLIDVLHSIPEQQFHIHQSYNFAELKKAINEPLFDIILLDMSLPDISADECISYLAETLPHTALIALDEEPDKDLAVNSIRLGAQDYLEKSICQDQLLQRVIKYSIERKLHDRLQKDYQLGVTETALNREIEFNLALFETSGALIVVLDSRGHIVRFNKACEKLTGYKWEEVNGKAVWEILLVQEDIEPVKNVFQQLAFGMFPNSHNNYWLTRSGDKRRIMWTNTTLHDKANNVEFVIGMGIDITEQNNAEMALKDREHDYRTLAENIPAIVYRTTVGESCRTTQYFNNIVTSISGYSPDELDQGSFCGCERFIHEDDREKVENAVNAAVEHDRTFEIEYRVKRKDGEIRYVIDRGRAVTNTVTGKKFIDGTISDITEHKNLLHNLSESEKMFRDLSEKSPVGIYMIQGTSFSYVNSRFSAIFGFGKDEMIGMNPVDLIHDDDKQTVVNSLQNQLEGKTSTFHMKLQALKKYGEVIDVDAYGNRTEYNNEPTVIGTLLDVTRQKIIEQALQEQMLRYEQILQTSMDGFLMAETSGKILDANPAFCEMLGYSYPELLNLNINQLRVDLVNNQSLITIDHYTGERTGAYETQYRHKDGHLIDMEVSINIMPTNDTDIAAMFARDITMRKREQNLERQRLAELAHASRVSTMGEMATEIAHELNQPLSAISTYSDAANAIANLESIDNQDLDDALQAISLQTKRAGDIIRSLRDFISKQDTNPTSTNINELVLRTLKLVNAEAMLNNIDIQFKPAKNLPSITTEQILIEQVILNLIRNAMEALSETDKEQWKIIITTRLTEDSMIEVNVEDNGPGLPYENPEQVFESFVTTKSAGMGMGLSISRNIIKAHSGELLARNNTSSGTCFSFTLPLHIGGE